MSKFLVAGNWKMNGERRFWQDLSADIALGSNSTSAELLLCPPFLGLGIVEEVAFDNISLGAQDVHMEASGAYTGSISVEMLKSAGCSYCIIGHSERREGYNESNKNIAAKARRCLENSIVPIICIGESIEIRESNQTIEFLKSQLEGSLNGVKINYADELVIAYEPIWAIGKKASREPTNTELIEVFNFLRSWVIDKYSNIGQKVRVLYGGSANPTNVTRLLEVEHIGGFLVGSAALNAEKFLEIAKLADKSIKLNT